MEVVLMRSALLVALLLLIGFGTQIVCAQDALTAKLLAQGGVKVMAGDKLLATLSLNAHGPAWKHVDQPAATAVVRDAETGPARIVEGSLPVPDTDGGAVRFVETVKPVEKGFSVAYSLGYTKAMALNGLQVSLLLPAEVFGGKSVVLHAPGEGDAAADRATEVALPEQLSAEKWQLATSPATKVEIAPGTENAITIAPKVPEAEAGAKVQLPKFIVQDLRKWDQNVFEIRLILIYDEKGKQVTAEDKANTELSVTFARALQLQ
jgi:hypothetical protein